MSLLTNRTIVAGCNGGGGGHSNRIGLNGFGLFVGEGGLSEEMGQEG